MNSISRSDMKCIPAAWIPAAELGWLTAILSWPRSFAATHGPWTRAGPSQERTQPVGGAHSRQPVEPVKQVHDQVKCSRKVQIQKKRL
jgi:hypothetical protein